MNAAFLSVYLPSLLLLPDAYSLRLPHLPPFSAAEFALIPLGVVGLARFARRGSFALMDLLVILFAASAGLSEVLHEPVRNDGVLAAVGAVVSMVFPYMVGRQLIEPSLRLATVRRFVILVVLNAIPGLYEWRLQQNLYGIFGEKFLGTSFQHGAWVQVRNGRGRLGGAFVDAEIAGIAFAMTFCLNAWLVYLRRVKIRVNLGKILTKLEKYHIPGLILLMCLWMTQSRGPEIALAAGYLILQIPRFKKTKLMTFVFAALLVAGYMEMSAYFRSYTDVSSHRLQDEQSSAVYRRKMNELYAPIAEQGGWTGWSVRAIPHVEGLLSIDNDYLLVHLAWGRLAYILFILITWENVRVALTRAWQFKSLQDRAFAFSMLAAMAVLWFTLLTVYLGEQLPQIAFLLIGWTQSMAPAKIATAADAKIAKTRSEKPALLHVFS
jgi:hypothetical protein